MTYTHENEGTHDYYYCCCDCGWIVVVGMEESTGLFEMILGLVTAPAAALIFASNVLVRLLWCGDWEKGGEDVTTWFDAFNVDAVEDGLTRGIGGVLNKPGSSNDEGNLRGERVLLRACAALLACSVDVSTVPLGLLVAVAADELSRVGLAWAWRRLAFKPKWLSGKVANKFALIKFCCVLLVLLGESVLTLEGIDRDGTVVFVFVLLIEEEEVEESREEEADDIRVGFDNCVDGNGRVERGTNCDA